LRADVPPKHCNPVLLALNGDDLSGCVQSGDYARFHKAGAIPAAQGKILMARISTRRSLLATTIIAGSLAASPAFAQAAAPAAADAATDDSTIVVTGSLITNPNLTSSSPVTAVGSEEIILRQTGTAEQILREIPGVVPGLGAQVNNGQTSSGATLNLRALGSNRNIVLLDSTRIVPANFNGTVDLNNIPLALIDRVDVLTGGASTTYGADAVSGVVNFITKKNFAGFAATVGNGITEQGDGNTLRVDLTIGANFDDGRGNAVLSIGYIESDPVYQGDRDVSVFGINSGTGVGAGSSFTSNPTVFSSTIFAPVVATSGGDVQINAAGTALVPFYSGFNFNPYNIFQTPFRRYNAFAQARYEISDTVEVYTRAMFSKNTTQSIIAPSGIFGTQQTINTANPFLTGTIRDQVCLANGFATAAACAAAPTLSLGGVYRRSVELGPRVSTYVTTLFDYQAGARFNISETLKFDLYGSYGESENIETRSGYVSNSRVAQALNATSATTCANTSNGCVPLNIFGPISPQTAAFIGGITSTVANRASLSQVHGVLNGDLFTIPSASEPVGFAVGAEYRNYGAERAPDSLAQVPGELGGAGGAVLPLNGGYDVYEAFGELIAPLASDKPFFDELSLEAGVRYSKYAVKAAGNPKYDATTYKIGLNWAPVSAIKFRANYQKAVRAPNIGELFAPVVTGLTSLAIDPCAGAAPVGNANLTAVCLAQGAPAASIGIIANPSAAQANATGGGNPLIKPEKADTLTLGVVLQPKDIIPGLSITVDYYDIKVNNAITAATSSDIIGACFNNITAASATNIACTSIRRNAGNGRLSGTSTAANPILGLPQPLTNLGRLATDGIDFKIAYKTDFGGVRFNYALNGNWTNHSKFRASPNSINRECVGYFSANCSSQGGAIQPRWNWTQRTTLGFDSVDVSLLWRHIGGVRYEGQAADFAARGFTATSRNLFNGTITGSGPLVGRSVNFNKIPSYDYFDLSTRISLTDDIQLTLTAFNIFNRKPPVLGAGAGSTAQNSGNTFPSTYDPLGRRYAASVNVRF
jgi:iron complex outermembrane recepter protein